MKADTEFTNYQSSKYQAAAEKVADVVNLAVSVSSSEAELEPWASYKIFATAWSTELTNIASSLLAHAYACVALASELDQTLAKAASGLSFESAG